MLRVLLVALLFMGSLGVRGNHRSCRCRGPRSGCARPACTGSAMVTNSRCGKSTTRWWQPKDGTSDIQLDHLQGELAERWEMSPDARTFTFWLRKGVQWQRGYGEVTSDDVAFTLARMKDPKTGTAYSSNFRQIESVDTPDRYTVIVHLSVPNPFFHAFALMPRFGGYIQCKKAVEELDDKLRQSPVGQRCVRLCRLRPEAKSRAACKRTILWRQAENRRAGGVVFAGDRVSHLGVC